MKDGIYKVELKMGGEIVVAEAEVRDGVLQGQGALEGIVGVFFVDGLKMQASRVSPGEVAPEEVVADNIKWRRIP